MQYNNTVPFHQTQRQKVKLILTDLEFIFILVILRYLLIIFTAIVPHHSSLSHTAGFYVLVSFSLCVIILSMSCFNFMFTLSLCLAGIQSSGWQFPLRAFLVLRGSSLLVDLRL